MHKLFSISNWTENCVKLTLMQAKRRLQLILHVAIYTKYDANVGLFTMLKKNCVNIKCLVG